MVHVISEKDDLVTDLVIEWLIDSKTNFIRHNDDEFKSTRLDVSNKEVNIVPFEKASKIWHRRGSLRFIPDPALRKYPNATQYLNYLSKEVKILKEYQEYKLRQRLGQNYVGSLQKESTNNKLINLSIAKKVGLKVPDTLVTNSKEELINFYQEKNKIISKDLKAPANIITKNKMTVASGVCLVKEKDIYSLPDSFVPMFFQAYVEKKYELRIFIFSDKIYPMAIFSQNDEQTKIDFRNYNDTKPNRCVPVNLPSDIEDKLRAFLKEVEMRTGSVDLIFTPEKEYYFLEINPMGQFHWLSQNCNYYIEKEIAKFLSDE